MNGRGWPRRPGREGRRAQSKRGGRLRSEVDHGLVAEWLALSETTDNGKAPPDGWAAEMKAQLRPGETVLAWFEPDLDQRLFYSAGLVVLTDRRLLGAERPPPATSTDGRRPHWQGWDLGPGVELSSKEHAGVGTLDL